MAKANELNGIKGFYKHPLEVIENIKDNEEV